MAFLSIRAWRDKLAQRQAEEVTVRLRDLQAAAVRLASVDKPSKQQLEEYAKNGDALFVS